MYIVILESHWQNNPVDSLKMSCKYECINAMKGEGHHRLNYYNTYHCLLQINCAVPVWLAMLLVCTICILFLLILCKKRQQQQQDFHRGNDWADNEGYRALAMLRSLKQSLEEREFHNSLNVSQISCWRLSPMNFPRCGSFKEWLIGLLAFSTHACKSEETDSPHFCISLIFQSLRNQILPFTGW